MAKASKTDGTEETYGSVPITQMAQSSNTDGTHEADEAVPKTQMASSSKTDDSQEADLPVLPVLEGKHVSDATHHFLGGPN